MELRFNVTGADRKALVKAMGNILQTEPKYLGMPTAAYEVGCFTVDKNGTVSFDDRADGGVIESLIEKLKNEGFVAVAQPESETPSHASEKAPQSAIENQGGELPAENGNALTDEISGLTIEMPLDKVKVGNLTALLEAKGKLIKKALGIEDTAIEVTNETVKFPWFSELPDADTVKA